MLDVFYNKEEILNDRSQSNDNFQCESIRLSFAIFAHEKWKNIIFSNEKIFNLNEREFLLS